MQGIARPQLDPLERERRQIEARRERNAARRDRILHAKTRIIGVDAPSLQSQIEEKKERERLERERDLYYDTLTSEHSKMITDQEIQRQRDKRREAEELNFFRHSQSQLAKTRQAAQELLDRENDSNLRFAGEDPYRQAREKAQKQQQADWLQQHMDIKRQQEYARQEEELAYAATQKALMEAIRQHEAERDRLRTLSTKNQASLNQLMAQEKKLRELQNKAEDMRLAQQDIENALNSDLMNEAVAPSAYGEHRHLGYAFKGFSTGQKQHILDQQRRQMEEQRLKRLQEAEEEKEEAARQESVRRALLLQERQRQEQEREKRRDLARTHQKQKEDHNMRTGYLNKVVYTNPVDESFFQQFGTSHR